MYVWLTGNKMGTTYTNSTSKRVLDKYAWTTLELVRTLIGFSKQGFLNDITTEYISLVEFKNMFIPIGISRLEIIDSDRTREYLPT